MSKPFVKGKEKKSSHKADFSRKFRLLILPFQTPGSTLELSLLSYTHAISLPHAHVCPYTYRNITDLPQIPISNSNNWC